MSSSYSDILSSCENIVMIHSSLTKSHIIAYHDMCIYVHLSVSVCRCMSVNAVTAVLLCPNRYKWTYSSVHSRGGRGEHILSSKKFHLVLEIESWPLLKNRQHISPPDKSAVILIHDLAIVLLFFCLLLCVMGALPRGINYLTKSIRLYSARPHAADGKGFGFSGNNVTSFFCQKELTVVH